MKQSIACWILLVCLATTSGESAPCGSQSCPGGPVSWTAQGHVVCCPPGSSMLIIHGKCSCHAPPPPPPDSASASSNSSSSDGGSVMMVSGRFNRTQLKEEMQQVMAGMRQMARWIRHNMGPGGR